MSQLASTDRPSRPLVRLALAATWIALLGTGFATLWADGLGVPMTDVTFQRSGGSQSRGFSASESGGQKAVLRQAITYPSASQASAAAALFAEMNRREELNGSDEVTRVYLRYDIRSDQVRSEYALVASGDAISPNFGSGECRLPNAASSGDARVVSVHCSGATAPVAVTFANATEARDFLQVVGLGQSIDEDCNAEVAKLLVNGRELVYIHFLPRH